MMVDQGSVNLAGDGKNLIIRRRHHHLETLQRRQAGRS